MILVSVLDSRIKLVRDSKSVKIGPFFFLFAVLFFLIVFVCLFSFVFVDNREL